MPAVNDEDPHRTDAPTDEAPNLTVDSTDEEWVAEGFLPASRVAELMDEAFLSVELHDGVLTEVRTFPPTAQPDPAEITGPVRDFLDRQEQRMARLGGGSAVMHDDEPPRKS
jgi:hypothetical protein